MSRGGDSRWIGGRSYGGKTKECCFSRRVLLEISKAAYRREKSYEFDLNCV
jgi:hypothetical protein